MEPSTQKAKCPICKIDASKQDFPFCSDRCRKVDLNRWLSGTYIISGDQDNTISKNQDDSSSHDED